MPTSRDRATWDKLHADYEAAYEAARSQEIEMRVKYGDHNWRTWAGKGERSRLEKLEARRDKIGNKILQLVLRISPRGEAWLTGAPIYWIYRDLTWEDAVRPKNEPLSVVVPAPFGADRGLTEARRKNPMPEHHRVRKPIADMIEELRSWLPNYDHGPKDYPTVLYRILASLPGGEELEDMGYEPFEIGWHELDQLARVLTVIEDKRDVEELVAGLIRDEEEEVGEHHRHHPMRRPPPAEPRPMSEDRIVDTHTVRREREVPPRRRQPKRAKRSRR